MRILPEPQPRRSDADAGEQFVGSGAGFGIGLLLLPFVFWLILAFGGAQYKDGSYTNTQPDMVEDVVNKAKDVVSGNHSNNEENNQ